MHLKGLKLKNVGPFQEAELEFAPGVTLITGENGTGKTIMLDAIRMMFGQHYGRLERDIIADPTSFKLDLSICWDPAGEQVFHAHSLSSPRILRVKPLALWDLPVHIANGRKRPAWVADHWRSALATDPFDIKRLVHPDPPQVLMGSLSGLHQNVEVTQLICFFDYLRDSRAPAERAAGEAFYALIERIVEASLLEGGHLSHVSRASFEPIVVQNGQELKLESLSSGNLYLIQRLVALAGRMFSVHTLSGPPLDEVRQVPGVLLIDEAENHLHPKWQKRFLSTILDLFPRMQIIATTHSPFIVSSVAGARVYLCESRGDHCELCDASEAFSGKSMEEILISRAFGGTWPFNQQVTALLEARKEAIAGGDSAERARLEAELQRINPDQFSYFDIEERLRQLAAE